MVVTEFSLVICVLIMYVENKIKNYYLIDNINLNVMFLSFSLPAILIHFIYFCVMLFEYLVILVNEIKNKLKRKGK